MQSIAIIGMSGRFPGAPDVAAFWRNLKGGVDSISRYPASELEAGNPEDAAKPGHVCARGLLEDIDMFDARFFGFLPKEAELIDPQQRVFLELAWQAIESAGYDAQRYGGAIGVFAGCFQNSYLLANLCSRPEFLQQLVDSIQTDALHVELGSEKDYLATQTAFRLGLRGPAMTVQTACSTSLVAAAAACQSLAAGECDMALAGGVTIVVPQKRGYVHKEGSILSADGYCRPFDAAASGTVFSNGGAVVLLKRLDDALADGDTIYAVIRGYALNNDGNRKVNYTAPSVAGQAEVISRALAMAGVEARSIGYVEAHGTATPVGDPIEVSGLTTAYAATTSDTGFCALGSVKANIGHLDVAAGAAGLVKVALALHEGVIPPLAHYSRPNPKIDFDRTPFYVNTDCREWKTDGAPRRAGISSFGLGGTNAHMILEQAPDPRPGGRARSGHLFPLSARSPAALAAQAERLAAHLESATDQDLADVAFTLQVGRREFDHRRFVVGADRSDVVARLRGSARPGESGPVAALRPPVVFMFPGQGSQYPGMGRELYREEPIFREVIDRCATALLDDPDSGFDLRDYLLWDAASGRPADEIEREMAQTRIAQPAIFAIEIALARLMTAWGIRPIALVGHSVGEFAAACLAGVFELEDAARLVATRGRLMQALPPGTMLAVRAGIDAVEGLRVDGVSIAAINAPELTVVSGPEDVVREFAKRADAAGLRTTALRTSHAFHSSMMAPMLAPLREAIAAVRRSAPQIAVHSTALARELAADEICDPAYWAQQVMEPVRFADAVAGAAGNGRRVFLELGPRQALSTFCRQVLGTDRSLAIVPVLGQGPGEQPEVEQVMGALGRLWISGVTPDWAAVHGGPRRRVPLPTYPFERKRFWIDPAPRHEGGLGAAAGDAQGQGGDPESVTVAKDGDGQEGLAATEIAERAESPHARLVARLTAIAADLSGYPAESLLPDATFMELGFDSLFMTQLAGHYQQEFGVRLTFRELLDDYPTLAALAEHIATSAAGTDGASSPAQAERAEAEIIDLPVAGAVEGEASLSFPLSDVQKELWVASQTSSEASCAFNESDIFRIDGPLDADLLASVVERVLDRHEAFRLRFDPDGEFQFVDIDARAQVERVDFSGKGDDAERALADLVAQAARTEFDLEHGPTHRCWLVRLGPESHALVMYFHHLVFDGYSGSLIMQEISAAYESARKGTEEPASTAVPYSTYLRLKEARRSNMEHHLAYWREVFASPPEPLDLPLDRQRAAMRGYEGSTVHRELPPELLESLRALARSQGCTMVSLLLATFHCLLSKLSGQQDIVVGITSAGQPHVGVDAVGNCVNALLIRGFVDDEKPFSSFLREVRGAVFDALEHQDVGIRELVQALRLPPTPGRLAMTDVFFNYSEYLADVRFEGCNVVAHENPRSSTFYDMFLHIVQSGGRLIVDWDYSTMLFDEETIQRWLDHYVELLRGVIRNPDEEIAELSLLSQEATAAVVAGWTGR